MTGNLITIIIEVISSLQQVCLEIMLSVFQEDTNKRY